MECFCSVTRMLLGAPGLTTRNKNATSTMRHVSTSWLKRLHAKETNEVLRTETNGVDTGLAGFQRTKIKNPDEFDKRSGHVIQNPFGGSKDHPEMLLNLVPVGFHSTNTGIDTPKPLLPTGQRRCTLHMFTLLFNGTAGHVSRRLAGPRRQESSESSPEDSGTCRRAVRPVVEQHTMPSGL